MGFGQSRNEEGMRRFTLSRSEYLLAIGQLARKKKRFYQFALTANRELGEAFEPSVIRHRRFCGEPIGHVGKLVYGHLPVSDAPNQVRHYGGVRLFLAVTLLKTFRASVA